jgi:inner membrane protein
MYPLGHLGVSLCGVAPVAAYLSRAGEPGLAAFALAVGAAVSSLPDADEHLPITHRGPTHTVWFVGAVSALAGAVGWALGALVGNPATLAALLAGVTALSLAAHLLADSITPMGISPFAPVLSAHHSFELVYAKDRRANLAFLSLGLVAVAVSQALVLF